MLCLGAAGEPLERSAGLLYAFMINFVLITHGTSPGCYCRNMYCTLLNPGAGGIARSDPGGVGCAADLGFPPPLVGLGRFGWLYNDFHWFSIGN